MFAIVDSLTTVKTILDAQWIPANTDGVTPLVQKIVDVKTADLANDDSVLLYEVDSPWEVFGLGAQEWHEKIIVSLDIRTTYKRVALHLIRPHLVLMKDEVFRILRANVADPDANFHLMKILRRRDLSDKTIGLGRMVIDISLEVWG